MEELNVPILRDIENDNNDDVKKKSEYTMGQIKTLLILIFLTVADGVLVVILFDKYTDRYSQYLNQGTYIFSDISAFIAQPNFNA